MKRLKRISIEVIIIFFIFFTVNYSFGIGKNQNIQRSSFERAAANLVGYAKVVPVATLADADFIKLINTYKDAGYYEEANSFPALAFDPGKRKLLIFNYKLPFKLTEKPLSSIESATFLASYRDAIVSSNRDLEERVKKLENTVSKIVLECCPPRR